MTRPFRALLLGVLVAGGATTARGDGATDAAIVLPAQLKGFFVSRDEYKKTVEQIMATRFKKASIVATVQPQPAACADELCFATVAAQQNAAFVANATIENNGARDTKYKLSVRLYSRGRGLVDKSEECANCTDAKAFEIVEQLLGAALSTPQQATPPPKEPPPAVPPINAPPTEAKKPPAWRRPTAIGLLSVGVIGVVTGIALIAVGAKGNHDPDCGSSFPDDRTCPFRKDATPLFGAGGAIMAVGVGLTIGGGVLLRQPSQGSAK